MSKPGALDRFGGLLDRVIGAISPAAAFRRQHARHATAQLRRIQARATAASAYEGARPTRDENWRVSSGSADADLDPDTLATLRERSRDRVRNDALAAAAIGSLTDNVVGVGIRPRLRLNPKRLGITPEKARELEETATKLWNEWGRRADSTGRLTIDDVQNLVFSQVLVNGDVLVQPVMIDRSKQRRRFQLCLEIIEGDRLGSPDGIESKTLRDGIELDPVVGEPVAYWVAETHPGDADNPTPQFRRIPAYTPAGRPRMLHLAGCERPGQTRGRPLLSPVLKLFKVRDDYVESALVGSWVGACYAAFVTRSDPYSAVLARATADTKSKSEREEELSPGMIGYLAEGEDIKFANPTQPSAIFEQFLGAVTRELTGALGMAREVALRDFHDTTYSQARASLLEARRMFQRRQKWVVEHLLRPTWQLMLEEAWLAGWFDAGHDFIERIEEWTEAHWIAPGWGHIEPLKEAQADEIRLRNRLTTRAKLVAAADGDEWEAVETQLAAEEERIAEHSANTSPPAAEDGDEPAPEDSAKPDESGDEPDPDEAEDETEDEEPEDDEAEVPQEALTR